MVLSLVLILTIHTFAVVRLEVSKIKATNICVAQLSTHFTAAASFGDETRKYRNSAHQRRQHLGAHSPISPLAGSQHPSYSRLVTEFPNICIEIAKKMRAGGLLHNHMGRRRIDEASDTLHQHSCMERVNS